MDGSSTKLNLTSVRRKNYIKFAKSEYPTGGPTWWMAWFKNKIEEYDKKTNGTFSIIIIDSLDIANYYRIPYLLVKPHLKDKFLDNQNRWILSIRNSDLCIHGTDTKIPVSKYHFHGSFDEMKNPIIINEGIARQQTDNNITPLTVSRPRYTIIESPSNVKEHKILFLDLLTKNIDLYEGPNKELQQYCPKFFELLSNILNDKFVDWHTKVMISAALGYFVLEDDVIPDAEENGYIDDLYLVTYILNEIKNNQSPEIIIRNWRGEEDIIRLIDEIFIKASDIVGPLSKEILKKVGLYKFSLLALEEYSGEYPKREARLMKEKRDLIALLAYIIQKVEDDKFKSRSYSEIKKYVENDGNYDEIQRIIEISKLYHEIEIESDGKEEKFRLMIERKMREAQLKIILEKK